MRRRQAMQPQDRLSQQCLKFVATRQIGEREVLIRGASLAERLSTKIEIPTWARLPGNLIGATIGDTITLVLVVCSFVGSKSPAKPAIYGLASICLP